MLLIPPFFISSIFDTATSEEEVLLCPMSSLLPQADVQSRSDVVSAAFIVFRWELTYEGA